MLKSSYRKNRTVMLASLSALLASFVISGIIIGLCGYNPFKVLKILFVDTFSTVPGITLSISSATPLIFTGLSFALAMKVGLINVGSEGQLLAGAFIGALVGAYAAFLPSFTLLAVSLLAGAAAGGLVSLFTTALKVKTGASEVIIGIMLNSIILFIINYFINGPFRPVNASIGQTKEVLLNARLPRLIKGTQITWGIVIAIIIAILLYLMLEKTVFGYKVRVIGQNKIAGEVAGIKASRIYLASSFMYGAIAGIGGACISLGIFYKFFENLSPGYGFAGIPVAALAGYNPAAVLLSGLLFGILKAGSNGLNRSGMPGEIINIIQALVVIFVSAPAIILPLFSLWKKGEAKK